MPTKRSGSLFNTSLAKNRIRTKVEGAPTFVQYTAATKLQARTNEALPNSSIHRMPTLDRSRERDVANPRVCDGHRHAVMTHVQYLQYAFGQSRPFGRGVVALCTQRGLVRVLENPPAKLASPVF